MASGKASRPFNQKGAFNPATKGNFSTTPSVRYATAHEDINSMNSLAVMDSAHGLSSGEKKTKEGDGLAVVPKLRKKRPPPPSKANDHQTGK